MREIEAALVAETVTRLFNEASFSLGDDVVQALEDASRRESNRQAARVLELLLRNAEIARAHSQPLCYDTGVPIVFVEKGVEAYIPGGLNKAIRSGLKKVLASTTFNRSHGLSCLHMDNATEPRPGVLHLEEVHGDKLLISVMPKGAGGENRSRIKLLKPDVTQTDLIDFVVKAVKRAGAEACGPLVIGVGLGGTFDRVGMLAKKALLSPVGRPNPDLGLARLELEMLEGINALGIGPAGIGGDTTALAVHVLAEPSYFESFPIAVNIQCNAMRFGEATI